MDVLTQYVKKFSKLRVDRSRGVPAPHKPILLLSIINGFEKGEIVDNKIYITPSLVATFKDYWHKLVLNSKFLPNFSLPFYHLKSDSFWFLQTLLGKEILLTSSHSIKSFLHLKEVVAYAFLDEELYRLLNIDGTRELLKRTILSTYFPNISTDLSNNKLVNEIINQILYEPAAVYKVRATTFDDEETFIRGGLFKKEIPKIYNYTCCISGMRIISNNEAQMIDACHIVPFSESHDDTITNGISLCPNLHRAFDRGLISIDHNYRVLVSDQFKEADNNSYTIKQFEGRQLQLPNNKSYFPSLDNLSMHRKRFNFYV